MRNTDGCIMEEAGGSGWRCKETGGGEAERGDYIRSEGPDVIKASLGIPVGCKGIMWQSIRWNEMKSGQAWAMMGGITVSSLDVFEDLGRSEEGLANVDVIVRPPRPRLDEIAWHVAWGVEWDKE
jgi:hypothetical protein